jgi:hypothetical protein
MENQNHGLILTPIVENDHYVMGGYSGIADRPILMPGGHGWGAFKPQPEYQARNGFDSMNCTNYGTHNALETLAAFKKYDYFPKDCSERYSGCLTGTTPGGNDPHHVIEVIRTQIGVVPEVDLPFTQDIASWQEYYTWQSAAWLLPFGSRFLKYFSIGHEWVFNGTAWDPSKQDKLKQALQHGTVALSVYAWKERNGLYFKEDSDQDEHWVQLLDYVDGVSWHVYDDYDQVEKDLEWHFNFFAAKVYYMEALPAPSPRTFWDVILDNFKRIGLLSGVVRP